MAKIGTLTITLNNVCTDTSCYWHTSHWEKICESGCYKLVNAKRCDPQKHYCTIEEGMKMEGRLLDSEE